MKLHSPLAATFIASALVACTSPTPPVAAQPSAPSARADAEATISRYPAEASEIRMSAEELRQRILKLIDSLHSGQDTNAPQVAEALGIELNPHSQSPNMRAAEILTTEGWPAYFITMKYSHVPSSRIDISTHPEDAGVGKVSKTCSFELNAFVADIEKMGYVFESKGRRGHQPVGSSFLRGTSYVYVQQYDVDDGSAGGKLCVYALLMESGDK